jgi:leishmanolysin
LYITYTNEPEDTYLAYAAWCRFLPKIGPTHGIVNFNYGILNGYKFNDNQQFEDLMEIVIHEMTHVMGFSGDDVENWIDSNK